jgi:hypothetical protein
VAAAAGEGGSDLPRPECPIVVAERMYMPYTAMGKSCGVGLFLPSYATVELRDAPMGTISHHAGPEQLLVSEDSRRASNERRPWCWHPAWRGGAQQLQDPSPPLFARVFPSLCNVYRGRMAVEGLGDLEGWPACRRGRPVLPTASAAYSTARHYVNERESGLVAHTHTHIHTHTHTHTQLVANARRSTARVSIQGPGRHWS